MNKACWLFCQHKIDVSTLTGTEQVLINTGRKDECKRSWIWTIHFFKKNFFLLRYDWYTRLSRFHMKKQCGYYTYPNYQVPTHIPMQSLSISAARCHRSTMCLLCATLFSPWPPTPCVLNIIPLNPLLPPSPTTLPHPSPLVTTSSFLESLSLLLFCFNLFLNICKIRKIN